jgi:hypothetical protein
MSTNDWVADRFPGDGAELPTDAERDQADAVIREWSLRWREEPVPIARTLPVKVSRWTDGQPGEVTRLMPTNRAFMRSRLRRWWAKTPTMKGPAS